MLYQKRIISVKLHLFFLITCSLTLTDGFGQSLQWADKVIEFSSELTPLQYSAEQALGKPNVLPAGGQNPNAWTPDKPKHKEFIKLGYANPAQIQQIAIAESQNPGALLHVFLYDVSGKEHLVYTFKPEAVPLQGRMVNIFVEKTPYKVNAVKLEFDGSVMHDSFALDAVAISDSPYPIIANIDLPQLLSKGLIVEPLDNNVNSDVSELNPLLSPDGKTLYFSRRNHPENTGGVHDKEDIWYSELGADGKWSLAKNMGTRINNAQPNFINTISATPDGQVILLLGNKYLDNGKMIDGISISTKEGDDWSTPKPLEIENDHNYNEKGNYFMANSRKTLLMSVQREDTRGDRDLYVSFEKADGKWTEPRNLGRTINTAGEESAPFLAADDITLYFSSNGFSGYGGSDVYMSKRLDDTWTNWSSPENLGPEINTKQDDLFFNIPPSGDYAYYSRGITAENTDVFRVKMPLVSSPASTITITGKLTDAKSGNPIGAGIIFEQMPDGKKAGTAKSNPENGEYKILLPGGIQYSFHVDAKDYLPESQTLDLRDFKKDAFITNKDIRISPITADVSITLNNVFFDFDKSVLKPESYPELNRLFGLMNERPGMTVEISGHTDPVGSETYNVGLSERRAKAVTNYLVEKGIAINRISTTYFGESQLIDKSNTREGNKKNRRVEFKIIKL